MMERDGAAAGTEQCPGRRGSSALEELEQGDGRGSRADLAVALRCFDNFDQLVIFIGLTVVEVGHVHAPARERAERGGLVVQHPRILVARIFLDLRVQGVQGRQRTFQYLKEPATVVEQAAGYVDFGVVIFSNALNVEQFLRRHLANCLADIDQLINRGHSRTFNVVIMPPSAILVALWMVHESRRGCTGLWL